MALTIGKLAAGVLPVVEKEIALLAGNPEGSTIKIQLLSRAQRLEIYPDAKPGDERSNLQAKVDAVNNKALPLRQELQDLRDDPDSNVDTTEQVEALKAEIAELEDQYTTLFEQLQEFELKRVAQLIQATLTDDTGDFLSAEQAHAFVFEKQNEAVIKQIISAIMESHGVGDAPESGEP